MKRFFIVAICVGLSISSIPTSQAADSISQIAAKIKKAGLGCKDAKLTGDKILYSGQRLTCTVNGEKLNIESYSPKNFKLATKYVCDMGFPMSAVSDGKTWLIGADTDATSAAIAKALKLKVINLCK